MSNRKKDKKSTKQPLVANVITKGSSAAPAGAPASRGVERSRTQLVEQARAAYALAWIQRAQADESIKQSELKSFTRRLPGMIQVNGFGQAMAFYYAKQSKSSAYRAVYSLIEGWLCGPHGHEANAGQPLYAAYVGTPPALLTAITQEDQHRYRLAQAETMALLRWAKKFAEALVAEEASVDD